ncbi:MAG: tRNA-(ms[2]io[6]A)-hydroxylase [Myxococcota bacterium]
MLRLRHDTPAAWTDVALAELDAFLQDHAANERKVSHSALSLVAQHPTRQKLVETLIEIAQEELEHFRQVYELLAARGQTLGQDVADPYMSRLFKAVKSRDFEAYLLDRLLLFGIVEARGCERFLMLAEALTDPALKAFYTELGQCEARHHATYVSLARHYFAREQVDARLDVLLDLEASVARELPLAPKLH